MGIEYMGVAMKYKIVLLAAMLMQALFVVDVSAEIYKWKDKDGVTRYTDLPPPQGVKPITTIKKSVPKPVPIDVTNPQTPIEVMNPQAAAGGKIEQKKEVMTPEQMDKKRKEIEQIEKRNKEEKEAQAKDKQLRCSAAKANYQSYSQGGRMYRMNEKGEREYLGDQDLSQGAAQAQQEIQQYCN